MIEIIPELQYQQLRHDEMAHRDILCLPVQDRIKHMVLHFAKYCGYLADAFESNNEFRFEPILVDTFIIVLASSNTLNINLANQLLEAAEHEDELSIGCKTDKDLANYMLLRLSKITGRMAKACESLDHLEKFDYREALEEGVIAIASLSIFIANMARVDLANLVKARWNGIEKKFDINTSELGRPINFESVRLVRESN